MLNSNALRGAYFTIMKCYAPRHELQRNILRHGGRIVDSIERKVSYLITTEESVNSSRMVIFAMENDIHIVNEMFVEGCIQSGGLLNIHDHRHSHYRLDWRVNYDEIEKLELEKNMNTDCTKPSPIALLGGVFVVCGRLKKSKTEIQTLIIQNGGKIIDSVTKRATHVVSSEDSLSSAKVQAGIAKSIPIVKEEFIQACIQRNRLLNLAEKANSQFCIVSANGNANSTKQFHIMREQGLMFQDTVFAISGRLFTAKEAFTGEILQRGGIIKEAVTGKTTHLISDGVTNAKVGKIKSKISRKPIEACILEEEIYIKIPNIIKFCIHCTCQSISMGVSKSYTTQNNPKGRQTNNTHQ
mmetsp:Transcript_17357/g.22874  ORF Transcript_17357/g.22874 Transcript_17357/m.22874 type:complete len:355 (-) Transcript_17357:51-1115(-)